MRHKIDKIAALFIVSTLAMTGVGAGVAHWSEYLWLSGDVETGELTMAVISVAVDEVEEKDWVANTYTELFDSNGDGWYDTILITVTNAYPSYSAYIHFTVQNVGTIPACLNNIIIDGPACIELDAWDSIGEQRDPGDRADNTMWFHVLQCAEELTTYEFTVTFHYVNWNEYPVP